MSVLTFPERGGIGWRCDPNSKWADLDLTNVRFVAQAFWKKHGAGGYAVLGIKASADEMAMAGAIAPLI